MEICRHDTEPLPIGGRDPGLICDILESAIAQVQHHPVLLCVELGGGTGSRPPTISITDQVKNTLPGQVVHLVKIGKAIPVQVCQQAAGRPSCSPDAGIPGHVLKGAVTVVPVKPVFSHVCQVDVRKPVIVEVPHC